MVNEVMFLLQHVHSQCPLPISTNHSSEHLDKIFIVNSKTLKQYISKVKKKSSFVHMN